MWWVLERLQVHYINQPPTHRPHHISSPPQLWLVYKYDIRERRSRHLARPQRPAQQTTTTTGRSELLHPHNCPNHSRHLIPT